jgi:L-seryl-tRNA(Ser) seleniumtransferase
MDRLLAQAAERGLPARLSRLAAQEVLAESRATGVPVAADVMDEVARRVRSWLLPSAPPVFNATGVVVHTNLGRAPWHEEAVAAAVAASGYVAVEMDLPSGLRGGRGSGVATWLRRMTGAADALVVNNNAAGVLLALTALAAGRDVVVSRGELVEIGGAFRVPDVVAAGGARLVEVGTTNRTHVSDYEAATGAQTALWLRVHRSNFRIEGFVETPERAALASAAHARGLPLVDDLGSGQMDGDEAVERALAQGADLVCFSGDKLLGGPQAGLVAGRADLVERCRRHPLYRALRVDKVVQAALEATLRVWATGRLPPVAEMLGATPEDLARRADALVAALANAGVAARRVASDGRAGGGALAEVPMPGFAAHVPCAQVDAVARRLRLGVPSVVPRVVDDGLWLDVRALPEGSAPAVAAAVAAALG